MKTNIGVKPENLSEVAGSLNKMLADEHVLYIKTRNAHWNVEGPDFYTQHKFFEEHYEALQDIIDEVAERILTLGHTPLHTFSDYIQTAAIKEAKNISDGKEAMQKVLDSFAILIGLQREILDAASEAGDEGTNALMSDYIREQEKLVWMYSAYLK